MDVLINTIIFYSDLFSFPFFPSSLHSFLPSSSILYFFLIFSFPLLPFSLFPFLFSSLMDSTHTNSIPSLLYRMWNNSWYRFLLECKYVIIVPKKRIKKKNNFQLLQFGIQIFIRTENERISCIRYCMWNHFLYSKEFRCRPYLVKWIDKYHF